MTNITIKVPDDLAKAARVMAAEQGTSLSRMVAEELERLVKRDVSYRQARKEAVKAIAEAGSLNYEAVDRDSLHER